jgi:hypothetical protein
MDGRPGIFLERAYETTVDSSDVINNQVQALKSELANAVGGVTDQRIKVAASRNPGGHYSDAGGGSKTTEYEVGP